MLKRLSLVVAAAAIALCTSCSSLKIEDASNIQVVIPDKALSVEIQAANEIAEKLEIATGKKIEVVNVVKNGGLPIRIGRAAKFANVPAKADHGIVAIGENAIDIAGCDGAADFADLHTPAGTYFAAIEFLERELGVRYLWPGDCGTYVPKSNGLKFAVKTYTVVPFVPQNEWCLGMSAENWYNPDNAKRYKDQTFRWLRQQRNSFAAGFAGYGHAFGGYYARYFKDHPEIFQLLPDGKRGPTDPTHPVFSSMCVTNPTFWDIIIKNWKGAPILNLNENDTAGKCCCPECLAHDMNPDTTRYDRAAKAFKENDHYWYRHLGSLSDRYAYFMLECQKRADKINPNHTIIGLIYANYYEPPKTKLNKRILMRYCPGLMFPWSDNTVKMAKDTWQGWYDAGVSLMFRPNCTWDGHNFSLLYYPEFADFVDFMADRGVIATDLDTLTGSFATNALNLYVIASKMAKGKNVSVSELEDDYFRAFGQAEPALRKYMKIMRKATLDGQDILEREKQANANIVGSSYYSSFFTVGVKFFTPEVLAAGDAAIREAETLAAKDADPLVAKRVAFLRTGFEDMKMVLGVQNAYLDYTDTGKPQNLAVAIKALEEYRKVNENKLYQNTGFFRRMENGKWPITLQNLGPNDFLLENWMIKFSPEKDANVPYVHVSTVTHWELQKAGLNYEKKHGKMYKGTAWYQVKFNLSQDQVQRVKSMDFGAVDGSGEYYLNGKKFWDRPYPFEGDGTSWSKPFSVPLTSDMFKVGENVMDVRVEKHIGRSGIWRPVIIKLK